MKDVVQYLLAAMNKVSRTPSVFNVCTGRSTTINQLARTIMSVSGREVGMKYQTARTGDIRVSVGAPGLSERLLQYRATESLASGLKKLIDYEFNGMAKSVDTKARPAINMERLVNAT